MLDDVEYVIRSIWLILPLLFWERSSQSTVQAKFKNTVKYLGPCLIIVLLFYWRSWVKRADGIEALSLFLKIDPLAQPYDYSDWTGFQNGLHLIGFNLFPFGAFLPILALCLRSIDKSSIH